MIVEINARTNDEIKLISGDEGKNIKMIEEMYDVKLNINPLEMSIDSNDQEVIECIKTLLDILLHMIHNGHQITSRDLIYIKKMIDTDNVSLLYELYKKKKMIEKTFTGKPIYPKTIKQVEYINSLETHDMVFGIGPAGTGKTYLAVVYAVSLLKKGVVKKLILTRPAVEAGESLGFLPGDLKEKIDPYLRPLYDALYDTLGEEAVKSYIERGIIEIAPLAYMRGRTLENAFAILDEAQNTTTMQMKMFLTRLGFNSKMVITGDVTQIDLPNGKKSGLVEACSILKNVKQIGIVEFERLDVVRHPLVQLIIDRYEKLK